MPGTDTDVLERERAEEAQAQADFESGMAEESGKPKAKEEPKPEPKQEQKPAPKPEPKPPEPKYVQLTEEQFNTLNAAAAKTATFDAQFSKAFGTIGNLQKALTALQTATPRGVKIEIPKDAFAAMEKDFPELAAHSRAALEKTLAGLTGTGPASAEIDPDLMKRLVAEHATQARLDAEIEALEDEYPDWRKIVGQVDISKQQPDPNNPFRKWLATKDAAYQARVNGTNSAAVLARAIRTFENETKAPATPAPDLKAQLRAARIKAAVQPRGDGGPAAPSRTDDDDFESGFNSR